MGEFIDESEIDWLDELANDLLGNTEPVVFSPEATQPKPDPPHESMINKLISKVYSGPTISDIESALSSSSTFRSGDSEGRGGSRPIISLPGKGFSKMENKYTLRIRSSGNGVMDDGYKWRKYGQKSIKNSPNPRSYYRCTNPRCNAKKQVERSTEDPETLIVTYEGLHLHYTYSHFVIPQPQDSLSNTSHHVPKKAKVQTTGSEALLTEAKPHSPTEQIQEQKQKMVQENAQQELLKDLTVEGPTNGEESMQQGLLLEEEHNPQGLLEDIVPLLVRKPCSSTTSSNEHSSSYSQASSPSYCSNLSWSPSSFYLDMGILSSIL